MTDVKKIAEVGLDFPWTDIIGLPFRVVNFENNGTHVQEDGKVIAKNDHEPYAHLLVEHPALDTDVTIPVINSDDYRLIVSVYDHPEIMLHKKLEDRELLVVYAPKNPQEDGKTTDGWHVLHFALAPGSFLESYIAENEENVVDNVNQLFGDYVYSGELGVNFIKNDQRFEQLKITLEAIRSGTVSDQEKRVISVKLIDKAALYSSQKKQLVDTLNEYYPTKEPRS